MSIFKTVFSVRSTTYAAPAARTGATSIPSDAPERAGEFDWLNRLYFSQTFFQLIQFFFQPVDFAGMVRFCSVELRNQLIRRFDIFFARASLA